MARRGLDEVTWLVMYFPEDFGGRGELSATIPGVPPVCSSKVCDKYFEIPVVGFSPMQ